MLSCHFYSNVENKYVMSLPITPMELLAPAGSLPVFEAAVAAGADAVYVGAPGLNARNLARDFSMAEIAAMIDHAHGRGVKVYVAMNSLIREEELADAAKILHLLAAFQADGVIFQDLAVYRLIRDYFPTLAMHASTLMGAHNSLAVTRMAKMGFSRVVLARELTLAEIEIIHQKCDVELEAFVHGAMCFAYSGLCLFSSYLGGKSGLRGRCVQPCRRRYRWGGGKAGKSGYPFSMNDLCGISLLPELAQAGVRSLKIEGRMRSVGYVDNVIRAYRLVLDHPEGGDQVMAEAEILLENAMGRRRTKGFFPGTAQDDIVSPGHSGNVGQFLGKIEAFSKKGPKVTLRAALAVGDRVRLHQEASGERQAFTVRSLSKGTQPVETAEAGDAVWVSMEEKAARGDSLYLVDTAGRRRSEAGGSTIQAGRWRKRVDELLAVRGLVQLLRTFAIPEEPVPAKQGRVPEKGGRPSSFASPAKKSRVPFAGARFWVKSDDPAHFAWQMPVRPGRLVLTLTRQSLVASRRLRLPKKMADGLVWALPPIIEESEIAFYRQAVKDLLARGNNSFQISHFGQLELFEEDEQQPAEQEGTPVRGARRAVPPQKLDLTGNYTLNVLNSLAVASLQQMGFSSVQLSVESDRAAIAALVRVTGGRGLGLTVYGRPALFTSRVSADVLRTGQTFTSPKGERIVLLKKFGQTVAVPDEPFSLFAEMDELASLGLDFVVVDLSFFGTSRRDNESVQNALAGAARNTAANRFNYGGHLD